MNNNGGIITLESRVREQINLHIDLIELAEDLSGHMSLAFDDFDGIILQKNVYRLIKKGKKGKVKVVRSGGIAAFYEPSGDEYDYLRREVTCMIGFALLNPSDKHDDGIENKTLSERAWVWRNMPYARIGKGGEKDLGGLVNAVFIPHHIVKPLYTFIVKTRSLLGYSAVMPKWVNDFMFQYNAELKRKEQARIEARELKLKLKEERNIERALAKNIAELEDVA